VIYRSFESNPFEFVVVAALRTKQLMAGCVPRVVPAHKCTSTASLEVLAGKVTRVPTLPVPSSTEKEVTRDAPQRVEAKASTARPDAVTMELSAP
jgi:DNA-directed RNA polymerase subunit K/omega